MMDLTKSQTLIWSGQQLSCDSPLYNTVFDFEFSTPIDIPSFKLAFDRLVLGNDSLRTIFKNVNGIPKQEIQAESTFELPVYDWSFEEDAFGKYTSWKEEKNTINFNLSKQCFDSALIKLSAEKYIWYFNLHHIITDAWSVSVMLEQLLSFYQLETTGEGSTIPTLYPFSAYRSFEEESSSSTSFQKEKQYWTEKIKYIPDAVEYFSLKPKQIRTQSKRTRIQLPSDISEQLKLLVQDARIRSLLPDLTYYNVFLTSLFAFQYRLSGQEHLAIASPFHNRVRPEFKATTGLFIEFFPLAVQISESDSFIDLFQKVRKESTDYLQNVKPGISPVETNKKINTILNYINVQPNTGDFPVKTNWLYSDHTDTSHAIRLEIHDFNGTGDFILDFDINCSHIPEQEHERTVHYFMRLFSAFLSDPSQKILSVPIVSNEEHDLQMEWGNSNKELTAIQESIIDVFQSVVHNKADRTALVCGEKHLSFLELDALSNQIAHLIRRTGVRKGEVVGVLQSRNEWAIVSIIGILKAGCTYMPIEPSYPSSRIEYMLKDTGTQLVLTESAYVDLVPSFCTKKCLDDTMLLTDLSKDFSPDQIGSSDSAYIIYTSGSTGQPKGSTVSHSNTFALVRDLDQRIYSRYDTELNVGLIAAFVFDPSIQQIFASLLLGHTLHIVPDEVKMSGQKLVQFFEAHSIAICDGTPSHLHLLLLGSKNAYLPKHLIIGGETLRSNVIREMKNHFTKSETVITNIYGVAECAVDSVSYNINLKDPIPFEGTIPIGRPLASERVYILNPDNQLQPQGVVGELCLGGLGVGSGYIKLDELTNAKFIDNPFCPGEKLYKTGDLARYSNAGIIDFVGRKDNQVKVRGHRIELGEVEQQMNAIQIDHSIRLENPKESEVKRCKRCLLSDKHPDTVFDQYGVCNTCNEFETYAEKSLQYFKTMTDLRELVDRSKRTKSSEYDCMLLYSGGKDSSYVLYRLVEMGLKVLAFTFDNGFISKAAFDNIKRQTSLLGVDSIIRKTDKMDEIFIESLTSDSTVCSGCFKSLTAISTEIADQEGINIIVTGLSRGQIFDTKLSGLYREGVFENREVESRLLEFRKMFHSSNDRTNHLLDIDLAQVDFENIQFVDFFRYDSTSVTDIREYLKVKDSYWRQPKDTGFCSSNCLMNDIGICVHSKNEGYHNYEAPLSWDIRLGISTREEVLPEVEGAVNIKQVSSILDRIGFFTKQIKKAVVVANENDAGETYLVGYFIANHKLTVKEIRNALDQKLPKYMIPDYFVQVERFPLTTNGKVDLRALPKHQQDRGLIENAFVAPRGEIEMLVSDIWKQVFGIDKIGVFDNFFEIGGNSLTAIRITSRLTEAIKLELPLKLVFEQPTIALYAEFIEATIRKKLAGMN